MRQMHDTGGASVAPPQRQTSGVQSLEHRIGALAELTIGELRQAWTEAWNAPPPKGARRRLMMLGIAWKWQAEVHGGFSKPLERRLATLEAAFRQGEARNLERSGATRLPRLQPGARLIRVWKGERHEVQVGQSGYHWRGRDWRSLSVIAREITGSRRNGPAFFGLARRAAP